MGTHWRAIAVAIFVSLLAPVVRAGSSGDGTVSFNRDVRPVLSDKCFACHGIDAKKRKAGLRLDVVEGATAELEGGVRAVVAGDLTKSELWQRINSDDDEKRMPPPKSHKTLSAVQKQIIRRWIEQGAKYQRHWSFEPITRPPVPHPAAGVKNSIDAFLFDRLEKEGLKPAPEADRPTLIRRVAFALTGLPPSLAELDRFLKDDAPDAYERMVDRYLASPRFGEEMARHWLDLARYGDTHGMHLDNERQMWAYRDYVIKSFNDNKPFDRFTIEQLAGDLLPEPTKEQLVATGFNRCNVTTSEGGSIDAEYAYRYAVDRTATMMTTWMGLTGGCAVCHDHKFDPISAREFYSLYAFFNSSADPAMDGNAMLTNPIIKLPNAQQEAKLTELETKLAARQKELDEKTDAIAYVDPATAEPRPEPKDAETVWLDDDFPPGAKPAGDPGQPTHWVTAAEGEKVFSGNRALKRTDKALAQDYYEGGAAPLQVPPDGLIFAYVYLDPNDLPKTVMLQFHTSEWKHRAVWGDYDAIQWGAPGTTEKVNMGALPEAGKWVRLEVPAEKIGLHPSDPVSGFALTQFGGTVYWDKLGVKGRRSDPANDPAQSLIAWQKSRTGKDTPGAPAPINALLKDGPEKVTKAEDVSRLRRYYLQNVCSATKPQLSLIADQIAATKKEKEEFEKSIPGTFIFRDAPAPRDSFVMLRGQYDKPGEKVEPGTPAFLPPLKKSAPNGRPTRLDLANWLVSPDHPLTARVAVNHFWQQLFGTGIVKSSGDFGAQGEPPSHPELLDWLADDFRESGWNVKALVRMMVLSAAFRQSSAMTPELLARDPENRLYARGPRFRLDAEQIRDNALAVSGLINLEMGGKGVRTYQPPNIWEPVAYVDSNTRFYKQDTGPALYRRSIYVFHKRTAPAPFLANFDAPSREQTCSRRERSDTPLQALQLMNDVQHVEAARVLAQRMLTEGGSSSEDRIAFAFRTVLARVPEPAETQIVLDELRSHLDHYTRDEDSARKLISHGESNPRPDLPPAEVASYTLVANMLLNLDETVTRN